MEGAQGLGLRLVGNWTRVLITAAVLLVIWLIFAWLAITGRLADLQYLKVPLVHPYPPNGYVQNPFNPGDKGDLISVSEAAKVKADLLKDGQVELRALETGDASLLDNVTTAGARDRIAALISQNNAAGVFEREQIKLDSVVTGRLADPNDSSITWMVEEHGSGLINYFSKTDNSLLRQQAVRFSSRFWLLKVGDRYVIADALVQSQPLASP